MLADILKQNNVNSRGMRFDPGARTALAFVTLKDNGEREFMFYRNPSADMLLEETELDFDIIKEVCEGSMWMVENWVGSQYQRTIGFWRVWFFPYLVTQYVMF